MQAPCSVNAFWIYLGLLVVREVVACRIPVKLHAEDGASYCLGSETAANLLSVSSVSGYPGNHHSGRSPPCILLLSPAFALVFSYQPMSRYAFPLALVLRLRYAQPWSKDSAMYVSASEGGG